MCLVLCIDFLKYNRGQNEQARGYAGNSPNRDDGVDIDSRINQGVRMITGAEKQITMELLEAEALADGMTQEILDAHMQSLNEHVAYVQEACRMFGCLPEYQIMAHDLSKYTLAEFPHYARQFKGPKNDPDGFAYAWLNHIHHNPHHWQHWMFPDGFTPKGSKAQNGIVQMPWNYVIEMVADWMGASKAYTGSWDMTDWLFKNLPKIKLHSATAAYLESVLCNGGPCDYTMVFCELRSNGIW